MTEQPSVDDESSNDTATTTGAVGDQASPPPTGVAAADAAAQRLAEITDAPVESHVGIYEDVHRRLQEGLADLDEQ